MDKRKFKRFKIRQMVQIGGKLGVINDISATGMQVATSLSPTERKISISIEAFGHLIELMGVIQWIKRKRTLQAPNQLGIIIKNAPPEYLLFVERLGT